MCDPDTLASCRQRIAVPRLLAALILGVATASCGSDTTTLTGPSPSKCQLSLALTTTSTIDASGGTGQIAVTTTPECMWIATTEAAWLTDISPASGQGSGQIDFRVAANSLPTAREGDVVVNDQRALVRQEAAACRFEIAPEAHDVGPSGGSASATVTTITGCEWTATSDDSWITVAPTTGHGSGTLNLAIAANDGNERAGAVRVADRLLAIRQSAATSCGFAVAPANQAIGAAGGAGVPITVTARAGCAWTVVSNVAWITVTGGASGSGNGVVTYTVAANTGSARTATLTIAGHSFTVTQGAAACSFTISPSNTTIGAAGGAGAPISVSTSAGCPWSVATDVGWITITSPQAGSGATTVSYNVAANSGAERRGVITVGGQSFSVTQGATCTYSVGPTSHAAPTAGGAVTVVVTAPGGCSWTAASNAAWITVNSGSTGNGSGTVLMTVAPNTGPSRTGTVAIAGKTFPVTQAAACTYSIAPASQSIGFEGGLGRPVAVTAPTGCTWAATSNVAWIIVATGQTGNGNGAVSFLVAPNTGSARSGTVTIAGEMFTVTQAALSRAPTPSRPQDTGLTTKEAKGLRSP